MAGIFLEGSRWRVAIRRKGYPPQNKSFKNKKLAEAWARKTETQMDEGEFGSRSGVTLRPIIEKFRDDVSPTRGGGRWEVVRLDCFLRTMLFLDKSYADDLSVDIRAWRDRRLKLVKPATVRRELGLLSAVISHAKEEWNLKGVNPVHEVKLPSKGKKRDRRPVEDELQRIYLQLQFDGATLPANGRGHQTLKCGWLVALSIETRMRLGDLCSILRENVHVDKRYVHLPATKNGDARDVPLSKYATELFRRYLERAPDKKNNGTLFGISAGCASGLYAEAAKRAGVKNLRFHDYKHEGVTRVTNRVPNALVAAKLSGHRDVKSTMVYYDATVQEQIAILDQAGL